MTTFISYAQNFEDIILNRALKDIVTGFYIDVGANDPIICSVTKAFYNKGWRGLNIEPIHSCHKKLIEDRPRDINVCVAAGNCPGEMVFYQVANYDALSTQDEATALSHSKTFNVPIESYNVPIQTIDMLCAEHNVETVHFMKIDVEKAEKNVLEGMELQKIRPWIILVEATLPSDPTPCHVEWEHLLITRGYQFVYFDGLNRFYIADEHMNRRDFFNIPPNVFDDFAFYHQIDAHNRINILNNQIMNHATHIQQLEQHIHELKKSRFFKKIKMMTKSIIKKCAIVICRMIIKVPFLKKYLLQFFRLARKLEYYLQ